MATPAMKNNLECFGLKRTYSHLKATMAHTTRTTMMMTKAKMVSTTNTIGSRSLSWFSTLWQRGLLAIFQLCPIFHQKVSQQYQPELSIYAKRTVGNFSFGITSHCNISTFVLFQYLPELTGQECFGKEGC